MEKNSKRVQMDQDQISSDKPSPDLRQKLRLNKETLRSLTSDALTSAAGGGSNVCWSKKPSLCYK